MAFLLAAFVMFVVAANVGFVANAAGYEDGVDDGKAAGFADGHKQGMIDARLNQGVEITVARCDGFEHGFNRARELCKLAIDKVSNN